MKAQLEITDRYMGVEVVLTVTEKDNGEIEIETDEEVTHPARERFKQAMESSHAIGGTFWPEPQTILNAIGIIESGFFDAMPWERKIKISGEVGEIPHEEGRVY